MISADLLAIVEKLNTQGKMVYSEGATKEQITQFEKEHNVILPIKYKEWLQYSDGGECFIPAGVQFYGVAHKPAINIHCNDRPSDKYFVIGALSTGDPILCEKDGETVSIYNQEAGRIEADETYCDFFAFVNDLYDILGIEG